MNQRSDADEVGRFVDQLYAATPHTPVTLVLVGTNVAVFLLMLTDGAGLLHADTRVHLAWGANFEPLTAGGEWWRLLTACFLHFGVIHLAANMWGLYDAGRLVERIFGSLPFALLYVAAGLTGSLASLLWNPGTTISGGASGAIFGVVGALVAFLLRQRHAVPAAVLGRVRASLIAFMAIALAFGMAVPGIDNAAHLGGLAAGFLLGLLLARPLAVVARGPALARLGLAAALAGATLATGALLVPAPAYDWHVEQKVRQELDAFARQETELLGTWQHVARLRGAGRIDAAQMADQISMLAAGWERTRRELSQVMPEAASPLRGVHAVALHYAERQRDAALALSEALRQKDPAAAAEFMAIQAELEELRRAMRSGAEASGSAPPGRGASR